MFRFLFAVVLALVAAVNVADAQKAVISSKTVVNPPGLFNRSVAKSTTVVRGNAGVGVQVNGVRVNGFHNNGFHSNGVRINGFNNHGFHNNGVRINGFHGHNHGFVPNNFNAVAFGGTKVVSVNGGGFHGDGFHGGFVPQGAFVSSKSVRFNAFGVRTQQDAFGNVFEVDAFGNSRFVGNRLGSSGFGSSSLSFGTGGFAPTCNSGFHQASFGY